MAGAQDVELGRREDLGRHTVLTIYTLVAALGLVSTLSAAHVGDEEPSSPEARPPRSDVTPHLGERSDAKPPLARSRPSRRAGRVPSLIRGALWTGMAALCMQELLGRLPGWFIPGLALLWGFFLLTLWLALDIRVHAPAREHTAAVGFLRWPFVALLVWFGGLASWLAVTVFWTALLVAFSRR